MTYCYECECACCGCGTCRCCHDKKDNCERIGHVNEREERKEELSATGGKHDYSPSCDVYGCDDNHITFQENHK